MGSQLMRVCLFLVLAGAVLGASGDPAGLYPVLERGYATEPIYFRLSVTAAAITTQAVLGRRGYGSKNLIVRNDGPGDVYASFASASVTTAASGGFKMTPDYNVSLSDFYTRVMSFRCSGTDTATVEIMETH